MTWGPDELLVERDRARELLASTEAQVAGLIRERDEWKAACQGAGVPNWWKQDMDDLRARLEASEGERDVWVGKSEDLRNKLDASDAGTGFVSRAELEKALGVLDSVASLGIECFTDGSTTAPRPGCECNTCETMREVEAIRALRKPDAKSEPPCPCNGSGWVMAGHNSDAVECNCGAGRKPDGAK